MFEKNMVSTLVNEMEHICGENNAEKAIEVTISLGALTGIQADSFKYWFYNITEGTFADGCKIQVETIGPEVFCESCNQTGHPPYPLMFCTHCKSSQVSLVSGDTIIIEDLAIQ